MRILQKEVQIKSAKSAYHVIVFKTNLAISDKLLHIFIAENKRYFIYKLLRCIVKNKVQDFLVGVRKQDPFHGSDAGLFWHIDR